MDIFRTVVKAFPIRRRSESARQRESRAEILKMYVIPEACNLFFPEEGSNVLVDEGSSSLAAASGSEERRSSGNTRGWRGTVCRSLGASYAGWTRRSVLLREIQRCVEIVSLNDDLLL